MKEYLTIELDNNKKLIIIDQLDKDNNIYFLTAELNESTEEISDEFEILKYNEKNNSIINLKYFELEEEIRNLFIERLEENKIEYDILEYLDNKQFIKLNIKDIKDSLYVLELNGKTIEKYLEFFTNTKPKVNDTIYISKKLLDIKLLSYGHFDNYNKLTEEDVLILKSDNYRVIYKRLYG